MAKAKKSLNRSQTIPQGFKIGFLGGGQLARMMILRAHELGLSPRVYCQSQDEPAAQVTSQVTLGAFANVKLLGKFLTDCDVITFESEFLDAELLENLSVQFRTQIFPEPEVMSTLQDRLLQKHSLIDFKIPTADFISVKTKGDLKDAHKLLGKTLILKQRKNGYDGNGTFFLTQGKDPKTLTKIFSNIEGGFIAEKKVDFKRELAIILVRDQFGEILHYPLVQSKQLNARCDWVMGPIKHREFNKLLKKLKDYLSALNYVGAIGFELFDSKGKLLVNEVAPRVHNSGHYSQLAASPDQFLAHVMAVSGFKLPKIQSLSKAFAMANLIGLSTAKIQIQSSLEASLHLYGKNANRSGRKMGHINSTASSPKKALKRALKERKKVLR